MRHRLAVLVMLLVACGSDSDSGDMRESLDMPGQSACRVIETGWGPAGTDAVRLEPVVSGLEVPWGIAFLPNGDWLVTERPGRVRLVRGGALVPAPVATIAVGESGEGGLLGIAVDPRFSSNRFFYVYYTAAGPNVNRIERYRLSEDGLSATADRVIVDSIPAGTFHDGGRLRFGPDERLYASTGDGRVPSRAQDDASLAGKLLRINSDGGAPEIVLKGLRNPQGFDWWSDDVLIMTDHGPTGELGRSGQDELTVVRLGSNLGWPAVSGCDSVDGSVTPSLSWREALPPGGAALYTGSRITGWTSNLLIGSLGSKHLQRVIFGEDGTVRGEVYFQGDPPNGFGRLREVVMGPDGELYVTTSNCDGRGTCGSEKDRILKLVR